MLVTSPPVASVIAARRSGFGKVSPAAARVMVEMETPSSAANLEGDSPSISKKSLSVMAGLFA